MATLDPFPPPPSCLNFEDIQSHPCLLCHLCLYASRCCLPHGSNTLSRSHSSTCEDLGVKMALKYENVFSRAKSWVGLTLEDKNARKAVYRRQICIFLLIKLKKIIIIKNHRKIKSKRQAFPTPKVVID